MATLDRTEVLRFYEGREEIDPQSLRWRTVCWLYDRESQWEGTREKAVEVAQVHRRATGHEEFIIFCQLKTLQGDRVLLQETLTEAREKVP